MSEMEATDMRKLSREARHERRVQVIRLRKAGRTYDEIALQTGLSRTGVFDICKRHEAAGAKALHDAPSGRQSGEGRLLDAAQEATVLQLINDKTPDQLKMPYALWMRAAVTQLIEQRFGIRLRVRTVGLYLARWGFTPHKPIKMACEQSATALKNWLDEAYPAIAARAKAEGAAIHWGDVRRRDFARKGETSMIRFNKQRNGLSMISTVTNKGQMRWCIFEGALTTSVLIGFLRRLIKGAGKKLFLIMDKMRAHQTKSVKAWLARHADAIKVFYLPSYSPELNRGEMANADIRQAGATRPPARTGRQLVNITPRQLQCAAPVRSDSQPLEA